MGIQASATEHEKSYPKTNNNQGWGADRRFLAEIEGKERVHMLCCHVQYAKGFTSVHVDSLCLVVELASEK